MNNWTQYVNFYFSWWRLTSLWLGISFLALGAKLCDAPDWDLGVSLLMAFVAYLSMPLFHRWLKVAVWESLLAAFLLGDFAVNTTYTLYWSVLGNQHASAVANYGASWALYLTCWLIWCAIPESLPQRRVD